MLRLGPAGRLSMRCNVVEKCRLSKPLGMTSPVPDPNVPLLELEHLSKSFGGVRALRDVRFDVKPGEVLCLAGENGCGKSTLIKIVSGVHQPERGAVMMFDGAVDRRARSGKGTGARHPGHLAGPRPLPRVVGRREYRVRTQSRPPSDARRPWRHEGGCTPHPRSARRRPRPRRARAVSGDRPAPDRGHRSRPRGGSTPRVHGRTHGLIEPGRNRCLAGDRAQAFGRGDRGRLRQPPLGGSARCLHACDGACATAPSSARFRRPA